MLTARRAVLLLCLACAATLIRGQDDFDLSEAVDFEDPTPAPTPKKPVITKKPGSDDGTGFDLGDALGGAGIPTKKPAPRPVPGGADDFDLAGAIDGDSNLPTKKPVPRPNPGGGTGTFGDEDLFDAAGFDPNKPDKPSGDGQSNTNDNPEEQKTSVVAGIVSAVGVALIGAVSSFIAYQKKKLCFKNSDGDGENVDMQQHGGDKAEPQVRRTLLE
ncbi:CD99 antigen-like isoform X2 [Pleurodeles waltl]|uniref:CD99 antigen-like isoform X2 n=1 Tax=Pleurodeles waltl TaxID=8319 RepID=UPI003709A371